MVECGWKGGDLMSMMPKPPYTLGGDYSELEQRVALTYTHAVFSDFLARNPGASSSERFDFFLSTFEASLDLAAKLRYDLS